MKRRYKFVAVMTGIAMAIALTGFALSTAEIMDNTQTTEPEHEPVIVEEVVRESVITDDPETVVEETIEEEPVIEEEPEPEYIEYTVKAGDSLWAIAKNHYGNGTLYGAIAAYNGISPQAVIHPGDILKIQNNAELEATAVSYSAPEDTTQETVETTPVPVAYNSSIGYGASSFDGEMGVEDAIAVIKDQPSLDTTGMTYMGNWRITGYDPHCDHCCGKHNGITASGNQAEFGVTAGCNNLPLGTKIYVEGYGVFRVDDRGGMSKNHIDIAAPSHDACYQMTGHANVYVISYPD